MTVGVQDPVSMPPAARFWWITIPRMGARLSPKLAQVLADGDILGAWRVGYGLSVVAFVAGLLAGLSRAGFEIHPIESIVLLLTLFAVGGLSSHLGALIIVGLITAGMFTIPVPLTEVGDTEWIGMAVGYGLLWTGVVSLPFMTRKILRQINLFSRLSDSMAIISIALFAVSILSVLTLLWSLGTGLLIAPAVSWYPGDQSVDVGSVRSGLSTNWVSFATAASVGALLRMVLQHATYKHASDSYAALQENKFAQTTPVAIGERLHGWPGALLRALWATILLVALYSSIAHILIVLFASAIVQLGQQQLVLFPSQYWRSRIHSVPFAARISAAILIVYAAIRLVVPADSAEIPAATAPLITSFALILLYLSNPGVTKSSS